ncbi:MAG: CHAT domain-containing protein [bacterium]
MVKKIAIALVGCIIIIFVIDWFSRPISLGKIETIFASMDLSEADFEKQLRKVISFYKNRGLSSDEELILNASLSDNTFILPGDSILIEKIVKLKSHGASEDKAFFVENNKILLYKLFFRLNNQVVYLKHFYPDQTDRVQTLLEVSQWIANIFDYSLQHRFLKSELDFNQNLEKSNLENKLKLELCYQKTSELIYRNPKEVEKYLGTGLKLAKKLKDKKRELDFLYRLQFLHYVKSLTNIGLAIGQYTSHSAEELGYKFRVGWTYFQNGNILIDKGRFRDALAQFEAAKTIFDWFNYPKAKAAIFERMGVVHRHLGEFEQALRDYDMFLELEKERPQSLARIRYLLGIGLIKFEMGQYSAAEQHYLKSIEIAKELFDPPNEAIAFTNLGDLYFELGNFDEAVENYSKALNLMEIDGTPHTIAEALINLTEVYAEKKDYEKAEVYAASALNQLAETDFGLLTARHFLNIGKLQLRIGEYNKALKTFQYALESLKKIEVVLDQLEALYLIGETYRRLQQFEEGLSTFQCALEIAQQFPLPIQNSNLYFGMGRIYEALNEIKTAEARFQNAIALIENVADSLYSEQHRSNYAEKIQPIFEEMVLLQLSKGDAKTAFLYSERERAQAFKNLLLGSSQIVPTPTFVSAGFRVNLRKTPHANSLNLDLLQALLNDETALLEYELTDSLLVIWLIKRNEFYVEKVPISRNEVDQLVIEFRENTVPEQVKTRQQLQKSFDKTVDLGKSFFDYLISPIEKYITDVKYLYFVPDETLHYFPFAAIIDSQNRFLIEDFTIATIPSAAIWHFIMEKKTQEDNATSKTKKLLAVAPQLKLTGAIEEARIVATRHPNCDTLIGTYATERALREKLLNQYHVILFSTHGKIDERRPYQSSLTLINDMNTVADFQDDGLLKLYEIHQLEFDSTDLVYLSACESAYGKLYRGEGLVSMQRAFMIAGANTVIANLWKVEDKFAKQLTVDFFDIWFKGNLNKAEALRLSQLKMIDRLSHNKLYNRPHPYFWAAVSLTGAYY